MPASANLTGPTPGARREGTGRARIGLLALLVLLAIGAWSGPGHAESIRVEDRRYDYRLYAAPDPKVIIIAFHGFTGSGAVMARQSRLHKRGAAAVVAYPSGYWTTWDSQPGSIDVRMTKALIDKLRRKFGDLPVCVTGISAGGSMAWRVAMELPVDALVAVAGPLNPATGSPVGSPRVLHLHGDADEMVQVRGGKGLFGQIPAARLGVERMRKAGAPAELRVIRGGTHEWDLGVGYDTTGEVLRFCGAM